MSKTGSVLIIEDVLRAAERIRDRLIGCGHHAEMICEEYVGDFYDSVRNRPFAERVWDVLVLDVNFHTEHFGGIWLHNKLARNHRDRWKHTIVYTRYGGTTVAGATDDPTTHEAFVMRVFADTAGIPFDCVLSNKVKGDQPLIDKINELLNCDAPGTG